MMRKIGLIFRREYWTRVKKKSFIILTLVVPLSIVLLMSLQFIVMALSTQKVRVAVIDDTGSFAQRLQDTPTLYFKKVNEPLASFRQTYAEQGYDGILHIPPIEVQQQRPAGIVYISDNVLGLSVKTHMQDALREEVQRQRAEKLGISATQYNSLQDVRINIEEEGSSGNSTGTSIAIMVGMLMGFVMYFVIFIYGNMVMRGVMEEKSSRIVEVILSSVSPFQLMMGKILGIGAVGLTQFAIWAIFMFLLNILGGVALSTMFGGNTPALNTSNANQELTTDMIEAMFQQLQALPIFTLIGAFFFFFCVGYLLYAALFAGFASAINDESDAQTLTLPISIPVVISVFILVAMMENPYSNLAFWTSLFPLTSPIIMPARVAFGVATWELALSMLLALLTAIGAVWAAAKIYRTGILLYGKKVNFAEIAKWVSYR